MIVEVDIYLFVMSEEAISTSHQAPAPVTLLRLVAPLIGRRLHYF